MLHREENKVFKIVCIARASLVGTAPEYLREHYVPVSSQLDIDVSSTTLYDIESTGAASQSLTLAVYSPTCRLVCFRLGTIFRCARVMLHFALFSQRFQTVLKHICLDHLGRPEPL